MPPNECQPPKTLFDGCLVQIALTLRSLGASAGLAGCGNCTAWQQPTALPGYRPRLMVMRGRLSPSPRLYC